MSLPTSILFDDDIDCNRTLYDEDIRYAYAISIIRIIMSILSIVGASSIIVTVFVTGKLSSSEVHPLFVLAVGDFILSCTWLFGGSLWLHVTDQPESQGLCYVLAVSTTILTIITYLLTVVYAAHALLKMKELYRNKGRQSLDVKNTTWTKHLLTGIMYLFCWIFPLLLVIPVTETRASLEDVAKNSCWCTVDFFNTRPENSIRENELNELAVIISGFVGAFYLVSSVVIILMYAVTLLLAWKVLKLQQGQQIDSNSKKIIKKLMIRASAFIFIFLLCGFPTFLASILIWSSVSRSSLQDHQDLFVFFFQAFVSPLQGILNALVYGWSRKEFRKAISLPVTRIRYLQKGRRRLHNEHENDDKTVGAGLLNVSRHDT